MSARLTRRTVFLLTVDLVAMFFGLLLALALRLGTEGSLHQLNNNNGWFKISFVSILWSAGMYFHDLYDYEVISRREEMIFRTVQALGLTWITLSVIYYLIPSLEVGRGTALYAIVITLILLVSIRICIYVMFDHPSVGERILIVGDGPEVADTIRLATSRRASGYRIVGFLGECRNGFLEPTQTVQKLGDISDLESVVKLRKIDRVVVGVRQRRGVLPSDVLLRLRLHGRVNIDECSTFYERISGKVRLDLLRPSLLIFSEYSRNTQIKIAFRNLVHRFLALLGLMISLPIAIVTAILIKLESRGPVFYRQERVGRNDTRFEVIKFRSMRDGAESNGEPVWATANDDRVTIVGIVIRKLRIDEIPQFWNILKGEMRFVGPRPERPYFVDQLATEIPFYEHRHLIAPGLTGWAQVNYPYGASVEDARQKLEYDLYYIKNQTLLLDLMIVLQTIKIIILGRGSR